MYGNMCFEGTMENVTIEEACDCPMECNSISYSFSIVSSPFVAEIMCPSKSGKEQFLMRDFYENKSPPQFLRRIIEYKTNYSSQEANYCTRNIQYRAEVIFRLATNSMSVTVISRRLSFFDKMSAFGMFRNRLEID